MHPDGQGDLGVAEPFEHAVGDRPVGEERGIAATAGVKQGSLAPDVQIGFLLTGETGIRQILGRGAGADGDGQVGLSGAAGKFLKGGNNFGAGLGRKLAGLDGLTDCGSGVGQGDLARLQPGQGFGDHVIQTIGCQVIAEGVGGGGKTGRHLDALGAQLADHFAQGRVFAPHECHIAA